MLAQELNFTSIEPKLEDLVGTWVPTPETLDYMREAGGYDISRHEIILREDGSFSFVNMPDWWSNGFGRSNQGFESLDGKWKIWKEFGDNYSFQLEYDNWIDTTVHLQNDQPPYRIFIYVGDPDSGHYMIFLREAGT